MFKKNSQYDQEGVGHGLEKASKITKGIVYLVLRRLVNLVVNLEREGISKYEEVGEIHGKTESGKEYKSPYGFRVKVGLNPEGFLSKRLNNNDSSQITQGALTSDGSK